MYLIQVCLIETYRKHPEFAHGRQGMPHLIIIADGWNVSGTDRLAAYHAMKVSLCNTQELRASHRSAGGGTDDTSEPLDGVQQGGPEGGCGADDTSGLPESGQVGHG